MAGERAKALSEDLHERAVLAANTAYRKSQGFPLTRMHRAIEAFERVLCRAGYEWQRRPEPEFKLEPAGADAPRMDNGSHHSRGGIARAEALSPERRSEIASKAATERWKKNAS